MLENYSYAFHRSHTVFTEFRASTFSELSEDSARLKSLNIILLKIQAQVKNIVYTENLESDISERQGHNFQYFFFQFPLIRSFFPLFAVIVLSTFSFSENVHEKTDFHPSPSHILGIKIMV